MDGMSQKIRIKLKSYDHALIDRSCQNIVKVVKGTGAAISGPIPLPTSEIQSVEGYKSVFPSKGFFKIGEVTDLTVALERYTDTSTADDKFSAGTATFGDDGIVLKFTIAGAADVTSRVDGTVNSEWTFDLSKKVDE